VDDVLQPAPAPRFSRTVPDVPTPPQPVTPENTNAALAPWVDDQRVEQWRRERLIE
jgi:hypothetical protein